MKIAQELFDKYEILAPSEENSDVFDQHTDCVDYDGFFKALADYKQSIIEMIDKRLAEVANWAKLDSDSVALFDRGYKQALTELKQKIEQLDKESE